MAEHKHGEMNTAEQEKTFNGFLTAAARVVMVTIAILIFMALINS